MGVRFELDFIQAGFVVIFTENFDKYFFFWLFS